MGQSALMRLASWSLHISRTGVLCKCQFKLTFPGRRSPRNPTTFPIQNFKLGFKRNAFWWSFLALHRLSRYAENRSAGFDGCNSESVAGSPVSERLPKWDSKLLVTWGRLPLTIITKIHCASVQMPVPPPTVPPAGRRRKTVQCQLSASVTSQLSIN